MLDARGALLVIGQLFVRPKSDAMRATQVILGSVAALAVGCSRPARQLSQQDFQSITNVIRGDTPEFILDIRPREDCVIVDTGRDRVVDHCYELKMTRGGWKIVWKGT